MTHVNYHACDGCGSKLEQEAHPTQLGIWSPEKEVRARFSLFEVAETRQGDYEIFEFCSAKCAVLAIKTQALLEV